MDKDTVRKIERYFRHHDLNSINVELLVNGYDAVSAQVIIQELHDTFMKLYNPQINNINEAHNMAVKMVFKSRILLQ